MNHSNPMPKPIVLIHNREDAGNNLEMNKETTPEFISPGQLYEAVYDNAFHPMIISRIHGEIIKYNEKFSNLFGFPPDEMRKLKVFDFFKTNDASFIKFVEDRNEKGIAKAEIRGIKKSGEIFPCRISSVLYRSDNGEERFMNTIVNISNHISARWDIAG
jgi:PAS domain S-box-containing protein